MAAVMIGTGPHKGPHTAVAISAAEEPRGQLRVRACAAQAERLLEWAQARPERTWAAGAPAAPGTCWPGSSCRRVSGCRASSPSSARGSGCWPPAM